MQHLQFNAEINAPLIRVWRFYDDLETLLKITPPATKVRIIGPPSEIKKGVRFTLVVRQPPLFFPIRWETIITEYLPPDLFVDEQGKGPFAYWHHEHRFEALSEARTRLTDTITYLPPLGPLGQIADRLFIRRQLTEMFAYRHQITRKLLEEK